MPAVRGDGMRGLAVFISDIRNCEICMCYARITQGHCRIASSSNPVTRLEVFVACYTRLPAYNSVFIGILEKRFWLKAKQNLKSIAGKSKEAEIKRINKELANIRSKF